VRAYKLTKQAFKVLKLLAKNDPKIAKKLKGIIEDLRRDAISGESLQGYRQFKKLKAVLFTGLGRSKAFGCGLLMIKRV